MIDKLKSSGSIEFSCESSIFHDYFPMKAKFVSNVPYADIKVSNVTRINDNASVPFSVVNVFQPN